MNLILQTNLLTKNYKKQKALDEVSLTIKKGEIYGLIGRNGAGKTTLLKIITKMTFPSSGEIQILGSTTSKEWTKALLRTGAVIETPVAYDNLTARQNLIYYCKLRGISNAKERIHEVLDLVDLKNTGKKKFKEFSLGMKQKLGIAIAILSQPEFLVLDEPINGLDPIAIADFRKFIQRLNLERQMTIIISSHILSELYAVATQFGIINDGKLIKEITKKEFDELSEGYIILKTPQVVQSSKLLEEKTNFNIKIVDSNEINIFEDQHRINEITSVLIKNNITVDGIHFYRQDLENYFTNLIS